jgi:acyl-coenzyme A thioesterase PaaI-like protein
MSGLEETLRSLVEDRTPHNKYLGIRLESVGPGEATCMVPPATALVGDLNAATTHGGVTAALIDVASGAAVCMALGRAQRIATLGYRYPLPQSPRPMLQGRRHDRLRASVCLS